jgi:hypothetical protein
MTVIDIERLERELSDSSARKRRANDYMRDGLAHYDEPIAFFCECDREQCFAPVWLTGSEYDGLRPRPGWQPIADHDRGRVVAQAVEAC